jgi:hypothetical protein
VLHRPAHRCVYHVRTCCSALRKTTIRSKLMVLCSEPYNHIGSVLPVIETLMPVYTNHKSKSHSSRRTQSKKSEPG